MFFVVIEAVGGDIIEWIISAWSERIKVEDCRESLVIAYSVISGIVIEEGNVDNEDSSG